MKINTAQTDLLHYGKRMPQPKGMPQAENTSGIFWKPENSRMGQNERWGNSKGIVESTASYADSIRASRAKAKDTSLKLKMLHYDFKSISTQILRSKTSVNARQVAAKARREVLRLKRQRQNGEYDEEELQNAISHAQAMERAAKKKARHLQEEEMIKVTGGPCAGELEEVDEEEIRQAEEDTEAVVEPVLEEQVFDEGEPVLDSEELILAVAEPEADLQELMDEVYESMEELLEETGLEDLADSMFSEAETEMDPADYEMMKRKHRAEEMKAISKADAEYLKAYFDKLEKMRASSVGISGGFQQNTASSGAFAFSSEAFSAQVPAAGGAIAVSGGEIDISI